MKDGESFIDAKLGSHRIRVSFERAATLLALGVLALALGACLLSIWPADWASRVADHINRIKDALGDFLFWLGSLLGLSWGRGHLDARLAAQRDGDR